MSKQDGDFGFIIVQNTPIGQYTYFFMCFLKKKKIENTKIELVIKVKEE